MSDEAKGWLVALAIICVMIVSCCAIVCWSNNKAFELGYSQVQKIGTTDVMWTKK